MFHVRYLSKFVILGQSNNWSNTAVNDTSIMEPGYRGQLLLFKMFLVSL